MSKKSITPHEVFLKHDVGYRKFVKDSIDGVSDCGLPQSRVNVIINDPTYLRSSKGSKKVKSEFLIRLSEEIPDLAKDIQICMLYHRNKLLRRKNNVFEMKSKEKTRSFLKWAGGKSKLIDNINDNILFKVEGNYVEPFVGSGAIALNIESTKFWINDVNPDLILLWKTIQTSVDELIHECLILFTDENNTKESYYKLRDEFNTTAVGLRRAALFVYLNRHCFNGLCRYNSKGKFNVPKGSYKKVGFPEKELRDASVKIKEWNVTNWDFRKVMEKLGEGDVGYCDPPYFPLTPTAAFNDYVKGGFSEQDQIDLAEYAKNAAGRGALVIISNHDTPISRKIYEEKGATIHMLNVKRTIASKTKNRKDAPEILAIFGKIKQEK